MRFCYANKESENIMQTVNFDRAFTEQVRVGNKQEQRAVWQKTLDDELRAEQKEVDRMKFNHERIMFEKDVITRLDDWENEMVLYGRQLNYMFFLMHRIAYFDDLLGGTGISKEVN